MKIRKHKKRTYLLYPTTHRDVDSMSFKQYYTFKYKHDMMKFINKYPFDLLGSYVYVDEEGANGFTGSVVEYLVWYNEYQANKGIPFKIVLKKTFTPKWWRSFKATKLEKLSYAFSHRIIELMTIIAYEMPDINPSHAKNLTKLFYKIGYKEIIPNEEEQQYIDQFMKDGPPFDYWCDRYYGLRMQTIIEYFKFKKLI